MKGPNMFKSIIAAVAVVTSISTTVSAEQVGFEGRNHLGVASWAESLHDYRTDAEAKFTRVGTKPSSEEAENVGERFSRLGRINGWLFQDLLNEGVPVPFIKDIRRISEAADNKEVVTVYHEGNDMYIDSNNIFCEAARQNEMSCAEFTLEFFLNTTDKPEQLFQALVSKSEGIHEANAKVGIVSDKRKISLLQKELARQAEVNQKTLDAILLLAETVQKLETENQTTNGQIAGIAEILKALVQNK